MCLLGASRLVLSPRLQTYSVDYAKTFSPIAEIGFLSPLPPILIDPCFYWMSRMSCCMVIPMSKSIWKNYLGLLFMERIVRCVTFTSLFFIKAWFGKFDDIVLRFGMRHCHFDYSISEWHWWVEGLPNASLIWKTWAWVFRWWDRWMELVYLRWSMAWMFWRTLVYWDRDLWIQLWSQCQTLCWSDEVASFRIILWSILLITMFSRFYGSVSCLD